LTSGLDPGGIHVQPRHHRQQRPAKSQGLLRQPVETARPRAPRRLSRGGKPDGRAQVWILRPLDKQAASAGNGITIGLESADRATVDAAYKAAMAAGGKDEGGPGLRPHYHANYYAAYLRDPDGTKLCIVCHRAP
jgi:catechol 2,3-dioxygenase-like lactoylglutathione lyase family enzyme